jgi:hypothetical protein
MRAAPDLRLPGVYFLPPPRAAGLGFPPLDVAAFVGFAERGPLHFPVPVDDLNAYRDIFGEELPLAWEPGGRTVYANLPRAVAGFFANGGRRCYVVRVAGEDATVTRFHVPSVVALSASGRVRLASLSASSPGRWAAKLRLGTRVQSTPLPPKAFEVQQDNRHHLAWKTGSAPEAIQTGDVLRLKLADGGQWLFLVADVERPPETPRAAKVVAKHTWQLATVIPASPPLFVQQASRLTLDGEKPLKVGGEVLPGERMIRLELTGDDDAVDKIQRGDVLRLKLSDGSTYLFPVAERRLMVETASPPAQRLQVGASVVLHLPSAALPTADLTRVERLRFDLLLQVGDERRPTLSDLAFNAGHPRFWGEVALLESSALHRQSSAGVGGAHRPSAPQKQSATAADATQAARAARLFREMQGDARIEETLNGRLDIVPLAGLLAPLDEDPKLTYLPLGMPPVVTEDDFIGPDETDIGNDDLDTFDPALFVDDYLVPYPLNPSAAESAQTLMAAAFDRHYIQDKRLHGMHSLLFVDEVALLSVPDAVHRRWERKPAEKPAKPPPPPEPPPPPPPCPPESPFVDCQQLSEEPVADSTTESTAAEQEATPPRWPELEPAKDFESNALLAIQQAVINLCQARSDAVGILTLPLHFEKRQCIKWQEALRQKLGLPRRKSVFDEARDIADLSYVAVYHPWLLVADENAPESLRPVPCDGVVCGMIAARERERQAWVAPANVPLQGVLGLSPLFSTNDWAELFDLQFNLVRPEPIDFRAMSAHTLSGERTLLQLSVRRLMILLRKLAIDRGMDFVFESNHERFREGVRVTLENLLRFMFERGAFSGATAEQAYRVVTDDSVNTPQDIEQGRFVVQIQVAPSQPMEFITVLLTRISEGLLLATEV